MCDTRSLDNDEYYYLSENHSWVAVLQSFVLMIVFRETQSFKIETMNVQFV